MLIEKTINIGSLDNIEKINSLSSSDKLDGYTVTVKLSSKTIQDTNTSVQTLTLTYKTLENENDSEDLQIMKGEEIIEDVIRRIQEFTHECSLSREITKDDNEAFIDTYVRNGVRHVVYVFRKEEQCIKKTNAVKSAKLRWVLR